MTNGFGAMPDYAAQVTPTDRWNIAAYIRALQLSQRSTRASVPAGQQFRPDRSGFRDSGKWRNSGGRPRNRGNNREHQRYGGKPGDEGPCVIRTVQSRALVVAVLAALAPFSDSLSNPARHSTPG